MFLRVVQRGVNIHKESDWLRQNSLPEGPGRQVPDTQVICEGLQYITMAVSRLLSSAKSLLLSHRSVIYALQLAVVGPNGGGTSPGVDARCCGFDSRFGQYN